MKSRNLILGGVIAAVICTVFLIYFRSIDRPPEGTRNEKPAIPVNPQREEGEFLDVQGVGKIAAGAAIRFTFYDERTGRKKGTLSCETWTPNRDTKEVVVTRPELTLQMPGGMIALVSAAEGTLSGERVDRNDFQPTQGRLTGDCRIVIDRSSARERLPLGERPQDRIEIAMNAMDFDLEKGEMRTADRVTVASYEFEIDGAGLDLVWNEGENRIESLDLRQGGRLVLHRALLNEMAGPPPGANGATAAGVPAQGDAVAQADAALRAKRARRTGYRCELSGLVSAEQYRDHELVATLDADRIDLQFDLGGSGAVATTQPAATQAGQSRDKLVIEWDGPLKILPEAAANPRSDLRRRLEATGHEVLLAHADGEVRCGRLAVHDETGQIWLYPSDGELVEIALEDGTSASAEDVYIDRRANVVKLAGNVRLSQPQNRPRQSASTLRCNLWAELHLADSSETEPMEAAGSASFLSVGKLQGATFAGEARVEMDRQSLAADRLEIDFRPGEVGDERLDALIDSAVAEGRVRLAARSDQLECGRLTVRFALNDAGRSFPSRLDATGAAVMRSGRATISGEHVIAELGPPPAPTSAPEDGPRAEFVLRKLTIEEKAELLDPERRVAARGERIEAFFKENELDQAAIVGVAAAPAYLHSPPYTLRGARIDVARPEQTLRINGDSKLTFRSNRGLQGRTTEKAVPVEVIAHESLVIDGRANRAEFRGDVIARSGDERLEADQLTILFEDIEKPAQVAGMSTMEAAATLLGTQDLAQASELVAGGESDSAAGRFTGLDAATSDTTKEPQRVIAENVLIESETFAPNDRQRSEALMHYALTAPRMEIELKTRLIRTPGETTLLMTNRRLPSGPEKARDGGPIPSALMTRGPSQTVMQCEGPMTYALGAEGPERRDRALFEGGVRFRHLAGRDMVNIEQMLPSLKDNPQLSARLKSRNTALHSERLECEFAVSSSESAALSGALQLAMLIATGKVDLRDEQDGGIRTVWCERLEFDRARSIVRVRGSSNADARVYYENPRTGEFAVPAVGPEFELDLETNTLKAGRISGDVRRGG